MQHCVLALAHMAKCATNTGEPDAALHLVGDMTKVKQLDVGFAVAGHQGLDADRLFVVLGLSECSWRLTLWHRAIVEHGRVTHFAFLTVLKHGLQLPLRGGRPGGGRVQSNNEARVRLGILLGLAKGMLLTF